MFVALAAQFVVERWLAREKEALLPVNVALGLLVVALVLIRVEWADSVGLPPWAEGLSPGERRLAHATERLFHWLMFLIPLSGLALVLVSGEGRDLRSSEWHVPWDRVGGNLLLAGHIVVLGVFFAAFVAHVGVVPKHQAADRGRLLCRML